MFPRNLEQSRWFNTHPEIVAAWFELLDRTMKRYGIATGNVLNMNEKGILMGVAGKVHKVSKKTLVSQKTCCALAGGLQNQLARSTATVTSNLHIYVPL